MFEPGDRVVVVQSRPFLHHDIGDTATVVKYMHRGSDPLIEVEWDKDRARSNVYANQFVKLAEVPFKNPVEDTREYLNIITGESNV